MSHVAFRSVPPRLGEAIVLYLDLGWIGWESCVYYTEASS